MSGLSDYSAKNVLNYITGTVPMPATPSVWVALMTAVDTDAGTGGTEVSGGSYARVQVAGALTLNGSFTTSSTTLTLASTAPAWLLALGSVATPGVGCNVYDVTNSQQIGTVASVSGTTVTLALAALHASSGAADSLIFSAFGVATGSAPSTSTNSAVVNFQQATASWGTVIAFECRDALTAGNLLDWDFIGNYSWLPFEIPTASSLATVKAHGYSSNDPVVFTAEYGGTLPTLSTGTMTGYTVNFVATPATDTINIDTTTGPATPIVTTSSGSGMVRKIVQQPIAINVAASFAASSLTITAA
jgi:hypothetical protein